MNAAEILARIELRLDALDLSVRAAEIKAGTPDGIRNIKRYVKGEITSKPKHATLEHIADALECSLEWLITGKNWHGATADMELLMKERDALKAQVDALQRKIEGLDHAIAIIERAPKKI